MRRSRGFAAVLAVILVIVSGLAGCSGGGHKTAQSTTAAQAARAVGQGEGQLSLVTWNGYAENGGNDQRVDWVTPFEKKTKCRLNIKYAADAQQMLDLMSKPNLHYDGVSAPPEIAGELIRRHQVAPVNTRLVDDYKNLDPRLREQLTVDDKQYAVPFVWGTNLMMYDQRSVRPAPDSWGAMFDPAQAKRYAGKLVVRDSYLTLGDAALYLKAHRRKLHIKDPFSLTTGQLDEASKVIAQQRPYVQKYWLNPSDAIDSFAGGGADLGQVWPYQADVLARGGRPETAITPREGVTGWMDGWMVGARADHPSCMYQWLNWTSSAQVQQQVAEWAGVAPANAEACARDRLRAQFCGAYHVGDRGYLDKITFAHSPLAKRCSGDPCATYADWTAAWQSARN